MGQVSRFQQTTVAVTDIAGESSANARTSSASEHMCSVRMLPWLRAQPLACDDMAQDATEYAGAIVFLSATSTKILRHPIQQYPTLQVGRGPIGSNHVVLGCVS